MAEDSDESLDFEQNGEPYPDAIEGFNRGVFSFNDGFITYVFSPVDTVYTGFFPQDIRNGFGNFYRNLGYPVRLVNALLQFKFDKVGKETASFALNTFFGVGGLFNITRNMPSLQNSPEDFSQTLAFWGLGEGHLPGHPHHGAILGARRRGHGGRLLPPPPDVPGDAGQRHATPWPDTTGSMRPRPTCRLQAKSRRNPSTSTRA